MIVSKTISTSSKKLYIKTNVTNKLALGIKKAGNNKSESFNHVVKVFNGELNISPDRLITKMYKYTTYILKEFNDAYLRKQCNYKVK